MDSSNPTYTLQSHENQESHLRKLVVFNTLRQSQIPCNSPPPNFGFPQYHPANHTCKRIAIQLQLNKPIPHNDLKDFSTRVHILHTWLQNIFGLTKPVPSSGATLRRWIARGLHRERSQFRRAFSLTPGFSPVNGAANVRKPFQR